MTFALYLTGVPGVGKSTVARLVESTAGAARYSYGEILTAALGDRVRTQAELRRESSSVISAADVAAADSFVRQELKQNRGRRHSVVDSHAVTAETYGMRAVPFARADLAALAISHIVCLTASENVIRTRLRDASEGRREQDSTDFELHQGLQASLALAYAVELGVPVGFIRADRPLDTVMSDVLKFVGAE
ncbi:ATP-binding protein [Microbacterium lacus]|uniref:ATP-binding protein n=1 Tax=Microbacterium lacus TaxID=415217 RepID=UPI0012FD0851|nr:ATP-binding protein [Microbacterium lacus]